MASVRGLVLLLLPLISAGLNQPQDSELTFLLPAGRQECFYQPALYNASMEVEYQVIGGAGLDVDFLGHHPVWDPSDYGEEEI
ncbi:unnamed protein product [Ranitomeya imitator]|uniref:GOLD domain-containing protein n=1 Tax=Ranitomeya imitator TaxID=111125 RepID=A0ABN9L8C2_9NEOB|nr:unnamed protein product [Ranitomeya imitator]